MKHISTYLLVPLALSAFGCAHHHMGSSNEAVAYLHGLGKNSKVTGVVRFQPVDCNIKVSTTISGLTANQAHGYHIHEFGDCSAADGSSAGGHFNPGHESHAAPTDKKHHAGDMGNLTADAKGNAQSESTLQCQPLEHLLGRSVVVHAKEDDFKTQPSGNSGDRIACGVIGLAK